MSKLGSGGRTALQKPISGAPPHNNRQNRSVLEILADLGHVVSAAGISAQFILPGDFRTPPRKIGGHHRVILRQSPARAVHFGGHRIMIAQITFQRFARASVLKANNKIRRNRGLDGNSRAQGRGLFHHRKILISGHKGRKQGLPHLSDQTRQLFERNIMAPYIICNYKSHKRRINLRLVQAFSIKNTRELLQNIKQIIRRNPSAKLCGDLVGLETV